MSSVADPSGVEQIGIGAEHGGAGRILDMRFQRDRSIVLELRSRGPRVDMVLLGGPENLLECPADGLETVGELSATIAPTAPPPMISIS